MAFFFDKVVHDLTQALRTAADPGEALGLVPNELLPPLLSLMTQPPYDVVDDRRYVARLHLQIKLRLDAPDVEQLSDKICDVAQALLHARHEPLLLLIEWPHLRKQLEVPLGAGQRRSQIVRDGGHELSR